MSDLYTLAQDAAETVVEAAPDIDTDTVFVIALGKDGHPRLGSAGANAADMALFKVLLATCLQTMLKAEHQAQIQTAAAGLVKMQKPRLVTP